MISSSSPSSIVSPPAAPSPSLPPLVNLVEYEARARSTLSKPIYDYYRSGAHDEVTLSLNETHFTRLLLRPRFLVDVSTIDTRVTLMGRHFPSPICVAPTAAQRMAHVSGEVATAQACALLGTLMCLSTLSTTPLEEVAQAGDAMWNTRKHAHFSDADTSADQAHAPRWFQLYVYKDRTVSEALIRRAEKEGYGALVLTVDTPQLGVRENDVRNRFTLPAHLAYSNFLTHHHPGHADSLSNQNLQEHSTSSREKNTKVDYADQPASGLAAYAGQMFDRSLTWKDVSWLKTVTKLPIVIKGVLCKEDAMECVKYGVNAIVVSNHGARQLDTAVSTLGALPEVVAACRGTNVEVYLDGGVRRGHDVFKALALGARAVFVGRPVLWGLAYAGRDGVHQVLSLLNSELQLTMSLAGTPTIKNITRERVMLDRDLLAHL